MKHELEKQRSNVEEDPIFPQGVKRVHQGKYKQR